ncbi:MAG TPA: hypothetical protein VLJ39_11860, partial [Tepidisphaeraceae bacterium]|nr:hypothetical protein [Tepidisphaeraceae bacterium]
KPGQKAASPPVADEQQFHYYYGIARAGGKLPQPLAFKVIYDAFTEQLPFRYYCDDAPVEPGINVFDLYPYYFTDGKPVDYRSDRKGPSKHPKPIGSRMGPQNMVCCGWALQALRAYPGIWEQAYSRKFKDDVRVQIDDRPRIKDAVVPYAQVFGDDVQLSVLSSHNTFEAIGRCPKDGMRLEIFSRPDGKGSHASVEIQPGKAITATNDKGEKLLIEGTVEPGNGLAFAFTLPYTVTKGQSAWANGVEHERLSVRAGGRLRNLYLASSEADVKAALERELGVGLKTWDAIFRDKGYIPTGVGTAGQGFDTFSDTGGYAHLISAAAEWILYQQGKNDWELQQIPQVIP